MSVVPTDVWLQESFDDPVDMLGRTKRGKGEGEAFYAYLRKQGMYRPTRQMKERFNELKDAGLWGKVSSFEKKYKRKWKGPDVPIYLFPIESRAGLFRSSTKKSGICFPDEIFLFLQTLENEKEYESLFVHEYHHCTRMKRLGKKEEEYTLLDSIVFEGLAENAVREYCGVEYVAPWTRKYSEGDLSEWYGEWIKPNLDLTRKDALHDELLHGKGKYPDLLGYAAGYQIIRAFVEKNGLNSVKAMGIPSSEFLK
ncbi:DUF2268 domain-containing protein [Rossellomorea marisflavi]|uniref:DUF2268 domain-containing protein n=1 Tax=Rossellomorea marisflavi TaxID=189381 RepID=UPI003515BC66